MSDDQGDPVPAISVILPASNEGGTLAACLGALLASDVAAGVEVIVIANGCHDDTADRARAHAGDFAARGWTLTVIERAAGGKLAALNVGDTAARGRIRVYLDADVTVSPPLLGQLLAALDHDAPLYASGRVEIAAPADWASRAYARIYAQVPFMTHGVPGCGLFAVNEAGRARWGDFPDIIADDTFVRLSFAPHERIGVPASYRWPLVAGFGNLVRVRRRQDRGVRQVAERFPALVANDDKPAFPLRDMLRLALREPVGFAVYSGVRLIAGLTGRGRQDWSRGR